MSNSFGIIQNRWRVFIALSIASLATLSLSCRGPQGMVGPDGNDGISDKQIRLPFIITGWGTADTSWSICYPGGYITNFKISNYVDIDSVIFCANMGSSDSSADCILELFDVTDSVVVGGSSLITNATGQYSPGWPWLYSGNLINSFPDKEISLAFRIRTNKQGSTVEVNTAVVLLYRK